VNEESLEKMIRTKPERIVSKKGKSLLVEMHDMALYSLHGRDYRTDHRLFEKSWNPSIFSEWLMTID
jgi:hypothetical protein